MVVSICTIHSPDQATEDASHNEHVQVQIGLADLERASMEKESDLLPGYLKTIGPSESFLCISNTTIEHGCVNLRFSHISRNIPMKMGKFSIVLLYWNPAVPCR